MPNVPWGPLGREYLCASLSSHTLRGRLTITWDFPKAVLTPLLEEQGLIPRAHRAARACHCNPTGHDALFWLLNHTLPDIHPDKHPYRERKKKKKKMEVSPLPQWVASKVAAGVKMGSHSFCPSSCSRRGSPNWIKVYIIGKNNTKHLQNVALPVRAIDHDKGCDPSGPGTRVIGQHTVLA